MTTEQATRGELAQLVEVQVYPTPEHGWTATVMAKPARLVEYQALTNGSVAKLRERYALQD